MRACATHPWRVVLAWVGIIAVLIVLVATVGGGLKDEFEIPGSDTQKATDLIESEFAAEQGGVLNLVFAAPEGQRLDTPERKEAIEGAIAELKTQQFKPTEDKAGIESVGDPFERPDVLGRRPDRLRRGAVRPRHLRRRTARPSSPCRTPCARRSSPPASPPSSTATPSSRRSSRARRSCSACSMALIVLLIVFRTFVATMIPIALALTALATAFLLLFILAGLTDINTITPLLVSMIGLGVGIDYSLFIVTRFRQLLHEGLSPADAAAEAGASAGRATIFAGTTVAISVTGLAFFGLDFVTKLGIGSALGVLTTVLIANSLLIAVLAKLGHKIDRLKVPFLRPIDDSRGGPREDADRALGPLRDARTRSRCSSSCSSPASLLAATSALVRLGASDQGTAAGGADGPACRTTCSPRGSAPGFNGPIPIVVDVNGDDDAPQRVFDSVLRSRRAWRPRASRSSTTRSRSRSCS